jgi:hypothetical protein
VSSLFRGEEWFRGSGISPVPNGNGFLVSVRVATGHGDHVNRVLADLKDFPAHYDVIEMGEWETRAASVASAWMLRKISFNKENPSDLLSQLLKVIESEKSRLEGRGQQRLVDVASRLRGMTRDVQEAWRRRHEE